MTDERPIPVPGLFWRLFKDSHFDHCSQFLRKVALFHSLGRRDIGFLMLSMFEKTYAEGQSLFEEGDIGRALFIVETGRVDLVKQAGGGATQVLASAGPGDFFGEMALLEEMPRSAGAVARTETKVFLLYRTRFFGLIQSRPRVGVLILDQLARLLSARLRSTSQRLVAQDVELVNRVRG